MYTIKPLPEFNEWLFGLKDGLTHRRLARRLDKVQRGLLGGGDKSTQQADIAAAIALSKTIEE